jgi:hypothetical protein
MRTITLKMSEKEFEAFFAMAEENVTMCTGSGDEDGDTFGDENRKRVKTVNRMLKYNRRKEVLSF